MQFTAGLIMIALLGSAMTSAKSDDAVQRVAKSATYIALVKQLDAEHDRIVEDIIKLVEIPAPPFKEAERAKAYRDMLLAAGLQDVEIDAEGNATGLYRGSGPAGGPVIVLAAHLDTVFPEGTPL